jgi:hypothetical protein
MPANGLPPTGQKKKLSFKKHIIETNRAKGAVGCLSTTAQKLKFWQIFSDLCLD